MGLFQSFALVLTVTVLAFNFIGDGLRDALDPRLGDQVGRSACRRR